MIDWIAEADAFHMSLQPFPRILFGRTILPTTPADRLLKTLSSVSNSVMVSIEVSVLGCTDFIFIQPSVKVGLLPRCFTQSASASHHQACKCMEITSHSSKITLMHTEHERPLTCCHVCEAPDFISPQLWPQNSPDLSPVDYWIWSFLEERVHGTRILDVDDLTCRWSDDATNWKVAAVWSTDHRPSNQTVAFTSWIMYSRTRTTLWVSAVTKFHWLLVRDRLYASAIMLDKLPMLETIFWVQRLKCQYFCQNHSNSLQILSFVSIW